MEKNLNNFQTNTILNFNKNFKIYIYTKKVNGIRIWNKCNWYKNGERSTKFFLNHEKNCATQGCFRIFIVDKKELNNPKQINYVLYNFYQTLFTKKINGIRIWSKCNCYKNGEKATKFFLNLEKYCATQGCFCMIIVNKKELNDHQQINDALYNLYQTLFKEKLHI